MKLGTNFKRFPLGCDLTEVVVGTCASDLEKIDLLGNCILANNIGAPIHICAYAFSDIGEKYGEKGIDIMEEVYNLTDVPLDLDHFGKYGAMKFPKEIVKCGGDCYNKGDSSSGCPKDRIHKRLIEQEIEREEDKEEWIKLSSSVAVNLTSEQGGVGHSAPFEEAEYVANLAKKHGKALETIMFVGDGYDDLITGFEKAIDMETLHTLRRTRATHGLMLLFGSFRIRRRQARVHSDQAASLLHAVQGSGRRVRDLS